MSLSADDAQHPEHGRKSQDPLPLIPTKGWASVSPRRLPPTSPTVTVRAFARAATAWAATGASAWPPNARLPTRFHAPSQGALDPNADRLFAGAPRPRAACQLLQWSASRAHQRPVRPPTCPWQATRRQTAPPLSERRQPGFLRPGVGRPFGRSTPTTTTARPGGFTLT